MNRRPSSVRVRAIGRFAAVAALALSSSAAAFAQTPPEPKPAIAPEKTVVAALVGDPYALATDPVSGEKLGATRVQRVHGGRRLTFASEETAKKFEAEPEKYLAALDEAMVAAQVKHYPMKECVVSGHEAGGEPIDVVKMNRLFRLCCADCVPMLAKDPTPYLAKLDAAVVAAQKPNYALDTCPITGKKLGSMGEPLDVVVGNRLVRLCCKGCVKKLNDDPLGAFAKVDAAKKN